MVSAWKLSWCGVVCFSFLTSAFAADSAAGTASTTNPAVKAVDRSSRPPQNAAAERPLPARVLVIVAKGDEACEKELARLRQAGGDFELMRARGWKIGAAEDSHLRIVDREEVPELVERLGIQAYPAVAAVRDGQIVRSFTAGCTTPLDMWTFGFLAKGNDERPAGSVPEEARVEWTGHYPLRGNHWSVDEDWAPTRENVLVHLRGPVHARQIRVDWIIEDWSYEELRSVHDDLHEKEMGGVSFGTRARESPSSSFSATKKFGGR